MELFQMIWSVEQDRPQIDFTLKGNQKDWSFMDDVGRGLVAPGKLPPLHLTIHHPDATLWDCYMLPGMIGLYSQRVTSVLRWGACDAFVFFEAVLNGIPYYIPHCQLPLDCLDTEHSTVEQLPSGRIARVAKYVFKTETIIEPSVFCIADLFGALFATGAVVTKLRGLSSRGIDFRRLL